MTPKFVKTKEQFDCADGFEPFICCQCVSFETFMLVDMKLHCDADHSVCEPEEKHYQCRNCNFATFSKFLFLIHQSNLCLKNVESKSENSIFDAKKDKKQKLFNCDYCSHTTKQAAYLKQHVLCKHTDPDKIQWLECDHCPFKTKLKCNLTCHVKNMHQKLTTNAKKAEFKCDQCPYTTQRASNLKRHVVCKHTNLDKVPWLKCGHCSYASKTTANLTLHVLRRHTNADQVQWFKCAQCPYKSKAKSDLKMHIAHKHNDKKSVKCDQCSFATKYRCSLRYHVLSKHTRREKMSKNGKK